MTFSIQNSPLEAVDEAVLALLIDQQERWLVERKVSAEIGDLAKEIASFANTDGGWVLVGITDDGGVAPGEPNGQTKKLFGDPHQWLGQKLRSWLDPMPVFDADIRERDGQTVVVIRVWRSERAPIVHTEQGVVYERGASEAIGIRSQERLRAMTARREAFVAEARARVAAPSSLPLIDRALGVVSAANSSLVHDELRVIVRVTPLQVVEEAFARIALGRAATEASIDDVVNAAKRFGARAYGNFDDSVTAKAVDLRPTIRQRGFSTRLTVNFDFGMGQSDRLSVAYAADAGGVLGLSMRRRQNPIGTLSGLVAEDVAEQWLAPAIALLLERLAAHHSPGDVRLDGWILGLGGRALRWGENARGGKHGSASVDGFVQAHADVSTPLSDEAVADIAWDWTRDLGRAAGLSLFAHP